MIDRIVICLLGLVFCLIVVQVYRERKGEDWIRVRREDLEKLKTLCEECQIQFEELTDNFKSLKKELLEAESS